MTPEEFIDKALNIPFKLGRGDWHACDCWGLVELYYAEVLEIELCDRSGHGVDHEGFQSGFFAKTRWHEVETPKNHDTVIMSAGGLEYGHIGIHWQGSVLHICDKTNCLFQPLTDRTVRGRITGFLTYQ